MKGNKLWLFALIGAVVISGVVTAYTIYFWGHKPGGPAEWAMFGDYVGGVANPLLGFLTIFLLILSLYYQSQELSATRQELAQSTKALQQANQLHDYNITLQTRNNLRPQLLEHFNDRIQTFHNTTKVPVGLFIDGVSISASLLEVIQIRRDDYDGSNTVAAEFVRSPDFSWDNRGWRNIPAYVSRFFFEALDALLAVIEHSDSELMTEVAYDKFDAAMNIMEVSGVYTSYEIRDLQKTIGQAIAKREAQAFPAYHKKTRVLKRD